MNYIYSDESLQTHKNTFIYDRADVAMDTVSFDLDASKFKEAIREN